MTNAQPESEAQANARETLDAHFAALDAMMEADWIAQGSPVDSEGQRQYRPQAVVEAELHEAQHGGA